MKGKPGNPPGRRKPPEEIEKPDKPDSNKEVPAKAKGRTTVEVVIEKSKRQPKPTVEEVEDEEDRHSSASARSKELPFRDVPPVERVPSGPILPRKPAEKIVKEASSVPEKAFEIKTKINDPDAVNMIRKKILDTEILVAVKHLIGGSPALQRDLHQQTAKTRQPVARKQAGKVILNQDVQNFTVRLVEDDSDEEESPRNIKVYESQQIENFEFDEDFIELKDLPYDQYVMVLTEGVGELPEGAIIMDDPVVQYLDTLKEGETPKQIFAGLTSAALRCVFPNINNSGEMEAIMDGGSQIVSMSEKEARSRGVPWDPDVHILMQSANGQVEKTLGLARNIPFEFESITVYLQVHILKSAPYKALLGRPFEILTESVVANSKDGSQTVTMTDPYTGSRITIPTHPRGHVRQIKRAQKDKKDTTTSPEKVQDF